MNTDTGEVSQLSDILKSQPDKKVPPQWIPEGAIVKIEGWPNARWRITGMKPNGRLFLKLVK